MVKTQDSEFIICAKQRGGPKTMKTPKTWVPKGLFVNLNRLQNPSKDAEKKNSNTQNITAEGREKHGNNFQWYILPDSYLGVGQNITSNHLKQKHINVY